MMELVVKIIQIVMTVFCNDITMFYIVVIGLVALTALTSACVHNDNNNVIIVISIIDSTHQCVYSLSTIRRTEWKVAVGTPVISINLQRTANKQFSDLVQMSFSLYGGPCFNMKLAMNSNNICPIHMGSM